MATARSLLFSWDDVERLPELRRLTFVLDNLPDAEVVAVLGARRRRGRDKHPVSAMWRALVAGVVLGAGFTDTRDFRPTGCRNPPDGDIVLPSRPGPHAPHVGTGRFPDSLDTGQSEHPRDTSNLSTLRVALLNSTPIRCTEWPWPRYFSA